MSGNYNTISSFSGNMPTLRNKQLLSKVNNIANLNTFSTIEETARTEKMSKSSQGKYFEEYSKLRTANLKLTSEIVKKDIEIINLNSINEQFLFGQENKNQMLKDFCTENISLKNEVSNLKMENESLKNYIKKLKFKIKYYKNLYETKIKSREELEVTGKNISESYENNDAADLNNASTSPRKNAKNDTIKAFKLIHGLNNDNSNIKVTEPFKSNYTMSMNLMPNENRNCKIPKNILSNENKKNSLARVNTNILKNDLERSSFKLSKISTLSRGSVKSKIDYYKRLTMNHLQFSNNDNLSLQLMINGQKSLFRYNSDLVGRIIHSNQFNTIEKLLMSYDIFKHQLETIDETKLDEIYFILKGIVNDYKSTLILLAKINKLLEVQHLFCERVTMTDIFEKICDIVCQTLDCDRTTLYLVDNVRKELWSKAAKDSNSIIKLPFGKGLAGYVAETKTNLVLDDAYFDPRFNQDYDKKTGYRTKSVLCVPVFDYNSREVIGVIQSLNKKIKPNIFDINDEITSELLSKMIGSQIKQSVEYADYTIHENKLKKILTTSPRFFTVDSISKLFDDCKSLIKNLFSTDRVELFLNMSKDNNEDKLCFAKHNEEGFVNIYDNHIKLGIIGNVIHKKSYTFIQSTYNSDLYNPVIDIETSLPVITMPILHPSNDNVVISVVQLEYGVARLGISDIRINQVNHIDYNILNLLVRIFSLNIMRFKSI